MPNSQPNPRLIPSPMVTAISGHHRRVGRADRLTTSVSPITAGTPAMPTSATTASLPILIHLLHALQVGQSHLRRQLERRVKLRPGLPGPPRQQGVELEN